MLFYTHVNVRIPIRTSTRRSTGLKNRGWGFECLRAYVMFSIGAGTNIGPLVLLSDVSLELVIMHYKGLGSPARAF